MPLSPGRALPAVSNLVAVATGIPRRGGGCRNGMGSLPSSSRGGVGAVLPGRGLRGKREGVGILAGWPVLAVCASARPRRRALKGCFPAWSQRVHVLRQRR